MRVTKGTIALLLGSFVVITHATLLVRVELQCDELFVVFVNSCQLLINTLLW